MARSELTVEDVVRTGLNPTYNNAATDGHAIDNASKRVFIHVKNGSGGSVDVTITTPSTVDGLAIADRVVAVPASGERMIGAFPEAVYSQEDATLGIDKAVYVDYSATTSVTIGVFKLPAV